MFGFKTKKDKRIEELEKQLSAVYMRTPKVVECKSNVVTLTSSVVIDDVPVEFLKEKLARNMVDEVKKHMRFDIDDITEDRNTKVLRGTIRVVVDQGAF